MPQGDWMSQFNSGRARTPGPARLLALPRLVPNTGQLAAQIGANQFYSRLTEARVMQAPGGPFINIKFDSSPFVKTVLAGNYRRPGGLEFRELERIWR
jgi:hypothetical protein